MRCQYTGPRQTVTVVGVDPGPVTSGLVVWRRDYQYTPINIGLNEAEIRHIRSAIKQARAAAAAESDVLVAVEGLTNYGSCVGATTLETGYVVGRVQEMADHEGIRCVTITRPDVALALCGSTRAKDSQLSAAARGFFTPCGGGKDPHKGVKANPGPLYRISGEHLWSALHTACAAVAIEEETR